VAYFKELFRHSAVGAVRKEKPFKQVSK